MLPGILTPNSPPTYLPIQASPYKISQVRERERERERERDRQTDRQGAGDRDRHELGFIEKGANEQCSVPICNRISAMTVHSTIKELGLRTSPVT